MMLVYISSGGKSHPLTLGGLHVFLMNDYQRMRRFFFFSPQAPKKVGGRPFELPEASAVRRPPTTISKCPAGRVPGDNPSYLLSSPFYSLSPSRNSDPGSHSRLFSPPTHYGPCLAFFIARRFQLFLHSSTRVELCLPTLGPLSS